MNETRAGKPTAEQKTDEDLMHEYQLGNERAFELLYQRYADRIYGYLKKKLTHEVAIDDIFQATFMKLHQARSKYDRSLPFGPWIFTICRNAWIDSLRSRQNEKLLEKELLESGYLLAIPAISHEIDLSKLKGDQRTAIELRYKDELSFVEIARRLETSPSNVRQIISRGIKRLKEFAMKNNDSGDVK